MSVFEGHGVLVTGGSRGIGRATCIEFARQGARVAVHYATNDQAARAVLDELPGDGHTMVGADLGAGEARALVADSIEAIGRIDVLVNNAGIYESHPVLTTSAGRRHPRGRRAHGRTGWWADRQRHLARSIPR
jgi:3-oxoacyl-[acyl-carrier protein] reductase